jgi:hypothetical protein
VSENLKTEQDVVDHVCGLADATLARIAALADQLDGLTNQLQALGEQISGADDDQLTNYLFQAALWAHQLSGNCSDGLASVIRDLKRDLLGRNGDR